MPACDRVVVACSGGPDSVALASIFDRIGARTGFEIVLVHVNAGLRASAWQDECAVLSVAARLNRQVKVAVLPPGRGDEARLRRDRYAALIDVARSVGAGAIATAHTAEDQTETVLLALFRGTGLAGLAGMAPASDFAGCAVLRPLLRITHADLEAEVARGALPFVRDPTNADRRYRRNVVRAALAEVRADFAQLDRSVARCAEIVRDELRGAERSAERRFLRAQLAARGELRDVPFERIEAALSAAPGRRTFLKAGVEYCAPENSKLRGRRSEPVSDGIGAMRSLAPMNEIEGVVFSRDEIAAAVRRMASSIACDYAGRTVLLLGVLKGALFFTADLARALSEIGADVNVQLDFLGVSSYGNSHRSSGEVRLIADTSHRIEGKHVLIIEDIIDNGLTLDYLMTLIGGRKPASLRAAVLLDKPYDRRAEVVVDYIGMTCPNEFVVGYGLDYQERYRTLPYVAKVRSETFTATCESVARAPGTPTSRNVFRGETF